MKRKFATLTLFILVGLLAGLLVGLLQHWLLPTDWNKSSVKYFHEPVGRLFINGVMMMVVPLVLVSLTVGTAAVGDIRKLGRIGGKTLAIYLSTTVLAIIIALTAASIIRPGSGIDKPIVEQVPDAVRPDILQIVVNIIPRNPFNSLITENMLQVIFIAVLLGLAITMVGPPAEPMLRGLKSAEKVIHRVIQLVMYLAPIGVFCLIAQVMIRYGPMTFGPLLKYLGTFFGVLLIQAFVVYPAYLLIFARVSPRQFYANIYPAVTLAFSTASSNVTLPISMSVAEDRLGVSEDVYSFTLPLGATINMDGTAIMQGVATVFIANFYGITLGLGELLQVVLMATLASIGTAGVPSVGLVMLTMVLVQVGLPVEGIGLIWGVDRIADMARTAVNITGDLAATTIVGKSEGALDGRVFAQPNIAPAMTAERLAVTAAAAERLAATATVDPGRATEVK